MAVSQHRGLQVGQQLLPKQTLVPNHLLQLRDQVIYTFFTKMIRMIFPTMYMIVMQQVLPGMPRQSYKQVRSRISKPSGLLSGIIMEQTESTIFSPTEQMFIGTIYTSEEAR